MVSQAGVGPRGSEPVSRLATSAHVLVLRYALAGRTATGTGTEPMRPGQQVDPRAEDLGLGVVGESLP